MKISDLIPKLYENNLDMNYIINNEEIELENGLKLNIDNSFLDTFAASATEKGIENFEKLFNIKANTETESLNFRRERILNRLVSAIPYTLQFLINKLNSMLGEGNWSYTIDYNNYSLNITSLVPGKSWYLELLNFLEQIIPCNIDWKITNYAATWGIVKDNFNSWNSLNDLTWQAIEDGEWLNN